MENRLKDVTLSVINELSVANIRCVMVTGDNLLTAMSVARECGIIRPTKKAFLITHSKTEKDPLGRTKLFIKESVSSSENDIDTDSEVRAFDRKAVLRTATYQMAIAGPTYSVITHEYPELVDRITAMCDVYARMAPDQKAQLIGALQEVPTAIIRIPNNLINFRLAPRFQCVVTVRTIVQLLKPLTQESPFPKLKLQLPPHSLPTSQIFVVCRPSSKKADVH